MLTPQDAINKQVLQAQGVMQRGLSTVMARMKGMDKAIALHHLMIVELLNEPGLSAEFKDKVRAMANRFGMKLDPYEQVAPPEEKPE